MVAMVFISNFPHEAVWAGSPTTMTNQESPAGNMRLVAGCKSYKYARCTVHKSLGIQGKGDIWVT